MGRARHWSQRPLTQTGRSPTCPGRLSARPGLAWAAGSRWIAETRAQTRNRELNSSLGLIPRIEAPRVSRLRQHLCLFLLPMTAFTQRPAQVHLRDRALRREVGRRGAAPSRSAELLWETSVTGLPHRPGLCHVDLGAQQCNIFICKKRMILNPFICFKSEPDMQPACPSLTAALKVSVFMGCRWRRGPCLRGLGSAYTAHSRFEEGSAPSAGGTAHIGAGTGSAQVHVEWTLAGSVALHSAAQPPYPPARHPTLSLHLLAVVSECSEMLGDWRSGVAGPVGPRAVCLSV